MTFGFGWGSKRSRSQETDPLLGSSSPPAYTPIAPEYGSSSNGPASASAQYIPSPQVVVQPVIFHHHHHHPGYHHRGHHHHHGRRRGSACKRFCCSLLLLSLFVAALVPAILYLDEIVRWVKRQTGLQGESNFNVPDNVATYECVGAMDWKARHVPLEDLFRFPKASETTFTIPTTSDFLYLISRGERSGGSFRLAASSSLPDNTALVSVVALYHVENVRNAAAKVCRVDKGFGPWGKHGVGIFTRNFDGNSKRRELQLEFRTTVYLPKLKLDSVLKGFEADLPNTRQEIDFFPDTPFGSFALNGSNAAINLRALSARRAQIHNANAAIEGTLRISKDLELANANGPIKVKVDLNRDESQGKVASAETIGTDGEKVVETSEEVVYDGPGRFNVTATTTNSPLTVHFISQPVDSSLIFKGQTTNSPALVSLAPSYEGTFTLATTLYSQESLKIRNSDADVEDPSGAGRRRMVWSHHYHELRKTMASGSVSWSHLFPDRDGDSSVVEVETTNSAVTLDL